jgi:serine/threonine protein kinase
MRCRECNLDLPAEARFCLSCGARVELVAPESPADPLLEALDKAIGFQYRIERLLGRGGMGAVYLAHELALDRDVAIKVLPPEHASTPQLRERFKREARTAARLSHPNIVPLHTFGEVSGLVYFVMGYVAGESLAARIRRQGPFDSEAARTFLASVCDALDYAHRQGIVHRDIKPDNILIEANSGTPLLTDFGISKATLTDAQLTTAGQLIGTPHYMSPEQAMGKADVGPRSDLYSLGIVAYEMLSGQRPFEAETPLDALTQRLTHDPRPLGSIAARVPQDLVQAINRCLQKDPATRWPDAKSLREVLVPSDEESEDTFAGRMLRTSTSVILLALLAVEYFAIFVALNPDVRLPDRLKRVLLGSLLVISAQMVLFGVAAAIRLRTYGIDAASIARKVLQQPHWSRSWYPRSLRRRGDMWDRLPRELRRFRALRGLMLMYVFAVFIPVQVLNQVGRGVLLQPDHPTLRRALYLIMFGAAAVLGALRQRAMKYIRATLATGAADASKILNTATWRASVWRRAPTASLLVAAAPPPSSVESESAAAETRLAGANDDERPTQAS